jgi:precorrin-2/cobalt-factor-2 C20-methyltransferase
MSRNLPVHAAHLTVVGLGPGDPHLITVKGVRAIEAAHLVFVPRSREDEESRALQIAAPWLDTTRQRIIYLHLPMRGTARNEPVYQAAADQIAAALDAWAAEHEQPGRSVYLLLGDPLLYGTFTYIWGELTARSPHIAVEVVPGITSFAAAAAQAPLPLAMGNERVAIVPATHEADTASLQRLFADFGTVVLLKVGSVLPQMLDMLDAAGLLATTTYAEYVGMPQQRIVHDVRTLRGERRPYLSLLIVRAGARYRE